MEVICRENHRPMNLSAETALSAVSETSIRLLTASLGSLSFGCVIRLRGAATDLAPVGSTTIVKTKTNSRPIMRGNMFPVLSCIVDLHSKSCRVVVLKRRFVQRNICRPALRVKCQNIRNMTTQPTGLSTQMNQIIH